MSARHQRKLRVEPRLTTAHPARYKSRSAMPVHMHCPELLLTSDPEDSGRRLLRHVSRHVATVIGRLTYSAVNTAKIATRGETEANFTRRQRNKQVVRNPGLHTITLRYQDHRPTS